MKKQTRSILIWVLLLLTTYGFGYWTGSFRAPRGPRIIVARDQSDISPRFGGGSVQSFYDPYFTPRNSMPDKVR